MGNLVNLPGVKGGKIADVKFAFSVTGAMQVLKTDRAVTGAGDHGAWSVWRDDTGNYRCEFDRHCVAINEFTAKTKVEIKTWLAEWLPKVKVRP